MGGAPDYLIVGGGSAGCILAARLSEDPANRVLLVEAGRDFDQSGENDLTDIAGARAFMDPRYFWPELEARYAADGESAASGAMPFKQARLLGGGSSINGQIALRGTPDDYDTWDRLGARGWAWNDVLKYFRRLETDHDFSGAGHGADGPINIRRTPREDWGTISQTISDIWSKLGYEYLPDLNGAFGDGHGPVPVNNDGKFRNSSVRQYLTGEVRARANLEIMTQTQALRVRLENGRAVGVEAERDGARFDLDAERVILSAGAMRSPQLLLLSGIGDARALSDLGLPVISHRPGVGQNLQDHPNIVISGCMASSAGKVFSQRSVLTYLRYSSGIAGCEPTDMVMSVRSRSMWHAVGSRIFGLVTYLTLPESRGTVTLRSSSPLASPVIDFNGMADERDRARLLKGVRFSMEIMRDHLGPDLVAEIFPAKLSRRIELLSRPNALNDGLSRIGATLMDASPRMRRLIVRHIITNGEDLGEILRDESSATEFIRNYLSTSWHPCGTCRMGDAAAPETVVDPDGAVVGIQGLFVADASIMPRITRTNTNIPTMMIAEHLAERIQRKA